MLATAFNGIAHARVAARWRWLSTSIGAASAKPKHPLDMTRDELNFVMSKGGLSPQAAQQFLRFVCRQGGELKDWPLVSDSRKAFLSKFVTTEIDALGGAHIITEQTADDGTRKFLIGFERGCGSAETAAAVAKKKPAAVETVYIPEKSPSGNERGVLCVSSQVGCALSCSFCHTGTQGFGRNLTHAQILAQLVLAKRALGDYAHNTASDSGAGNNINSTVNESVSNLVFMGQGEPLLNFKAVSAAVLTLINPYGFEIARRRVTISTSGIAPLISRVGSELGVSLALSLHAPSDELRSRIMGINKQYPLSAVMAACQQYSGSKTGAPRKILVEYTMLKGVNDNEACAAELADLLKRHELHCAVNLIPFNPWTGSPYECSSDATIIGFAKALSDRGLVTTVRWPRGRDISAACGQLRTAAAVSARQAVGAKQNLAGAAGLLYFTEIAASATVLPL